MRILLTGGGTGGHVYPALTVARELKNTFKDVEILYLGTPRGLEADLVPKSGIPFRTITAEGMKRKFSYKFFITGFKLCCGFLQSLAALQGFRPQVLLATGGYVCAPVVAAAALKRIPIVLHEQNAIPGFTNRMLARYAHTVCLTFPGSEKYFIQKPRFLFTGLPVRPEVLSIKREDAQKELKLNPDNFTLAITGGSRGARSINRAAVKLLKKILPVYSDLQVILITGKKDYRQTVYEFSREGIDLSKKGKITIMPYFYRMELILAVADLIVGRAGAAFLAEIAARGVPSVLIPYPYATDNHQEFNARYFVERGAAVMVSDSELSGETLYLEVVRLLNDGKIREKMAAKLRSLGKPGASEEIVRIVVDLVKENSIKN